MSEVTKIGFLISGKASNLEKFKKLIDSSDFEISFVCSSSPDAAGLALSKEYGLKSIIVDYQQIKEELEKRKRGDLGISIEDVHSSTTEVHNKFGGYLRRQLFHIQWLVHAEYELLQVLEQQDFDLLCLDDFHLTLTSYFTNSLDRQRDLFKAVAMSELFSSAAAV